MPILILEGLLLMAMIAIAISIILGRKLLSAAVIYCAFSLAAMVLYTIAGAADVAFTEAIIGTISTVYFIIAGKEGSGRGRFIRDRRGERRWKKRGLGEKKL